MKAKIDAIKRQARTPNSSLVTAKMKSVWASGRMRLTVLLPVPCRTSRRTGSNRAPCPPETYRPCRHSARIDEFEDAGAHMRHEFIGKQRGSHTAPPRPATHSQCSPAMKTAPSKPARPASSDRNPAAESKGQWSPAQQQGEKVGWNVAPLTGLRKGPCHENDEGRFRNSEAVCRRSSAAIP